MKLKDLSIVFILGVLEISKVQADGICLVENTRDPKSYGFQCFRSDNYLTDINNAPIDTSLLLFKISKIQEIRNESFIRFGESLMILLVIDSGVKKIEDNAFRGLTKLEVLNFKGNEIEIIKAAWFKGLSSLCIVSFKNNQVKHIEDDFFTSLPPYMDLLDVSENQLTCLPDIALTGGFRVHSLHVKHNPLTWTCQTLLMNWFENTKFEIEYHGRPHHLDTVGQPDDLAAICAAKLPSKLQPDEEFLNNCAEETTREFLPVKENYTVKELCEFLKNKSSPVLDCNE